MKAKRHQGTAKRVGITGTGKLTRGRQHAGHLKAKKRPKRKRALRSIVPVHPADQAQVRRLLPGS